MIDVIYIERLTRDKVNGQSLPVGVSASNVQITKLKLDKQREDLLDRKKLGREAAAKFKEKRDN